jgi:2-hydroxychromene-2-carboxylate isomerase
MDAIDLDFYFDPACGWAWRTSLWIREVATKRPINVTWRVVSLGVINAPEDGRSGPPMGQVRGARAVRTLIQAQRHGGNAAVDRLYVSYGNANHGRGDDMNDPPVHERCLDEAGLPPDLHSIALDDATTETEMVDATRAAMHKLRLFGVPTLALSGSDVGVFGPVIHPVPVGQEALDLWDYVRFSLERPYLYEMKRARDKYDRPQFADARGLAVEPVQA